MGRSSPAGRVTASLAASPARPWSAADRNRADLARTEIRTIDGEF